MNVIILLMAMIGLCVAAPQYYIPSEFVYQHPANVLNSAIEDTLPNELRNNFYKNPRIAARLAKESWFFNKEMQVKIIPFILIYFFYNVMKICFMILNVALIDFETRLLDLLLKSENTAFATLSLSLSLIPILSPSVTDISYFLINS